MMCDCIWPVSFDSKLIFANQIPYEVGHGVKVIYDTLPDRLRLK
jgi:hypothetical protein